MQTHTKKFLKASKSRSTNNVIRQRIPNSNASRREKALTDIRVNNGRKDPVTVTPSSCLRWANKQIIGHNT